MPLSPRRPRIGPGLATAGNALALCILVFFGLSARVLFQTQPNSAPAAATHAAAAPARVLLIVLDGLRVDTAADATLMPRVQALAARGSRGVAQVESLIPSTLAGIRAIVEGIVVAPAAFVFDFVSPRASSGGIFSAARQAGGRTFVAGPRLWVDLYGPWIDQHETDTSLAGADEQALAAALRFLPGREWRLGVVHLCRPDVAAHVSGGRSHAYNAAASWCDSAVGQLAAAAGPDAIVLITSDHGVTASGGHAGPEREVLATPVVLAGPLAGRLPATVRQPELAGLVTSLLQGRPAPPASVPTSRHISPVELCWRLALAAATVLATATLLVVAPALPPSSHVATWLHTGVWIVIVLLTVAPTVAAAAGLLLLATSALRSRRHLARRSAFVIGCAILAGTAGGALRLRASQAAPASSAPAHFYFIGWAGAALLALILGGVIRRGIALPHVRGGPQVAAATALAVLVVEIAFSPALRAVSLSTLDVRGAFALVGAGWPLPLAALIPALQPSMPMLILFAISLTRVRSLTPDVFVGIASGAAAILLGETIIASLALGIVLPASPPELAALGLGLLARTAAAVAILFPALAILAWLRRRNLLAPVV